MGKDYGANSLFEERIPSSTRRRVDMRQGREGRQTEGVLSNLMM